MTNTTTNSSSDPQLNCNSASCIFTRGELDLIVVSLFSITAISLAGNIPILIVILFSSKRRNSSNLSTINLVISDLLMTIFCIPFVTLDLYVFDAWVFGSVMCHLVTFVQNTAIQASLMNLLTITCEKFLAVRFPFHLRLRKKMVCHFMPVAWLIAMAESGFYLRFRKMKQSVGGSTTYCTDDWPDEESYKNKVIVKTVMFFCPLAIIIILHSITVYTLHKGRNTFQLDTNTRGSFRNAVRKQKRQRKAVKIILLTLISIIVCWGPSHFLYALFLFDFAKQFSVRSINIGYTICACLLYSHCSVFPLIYCLFTQKGRETIAVCSLCLRTCRISGDSPNTTSLLLDASNNQSSFRGLGRQSSWRRGSSTHGETRL